MYKCHRFPKLFPCTKYSLDLTLVKSFSRLASIVIEGGREGREWSRKRRLPGSSRTYDNIGIHRRHLLVRARRAENVNEWRERKGCGKITRSVLSACLVDNNATNAHHAIHRSKFIGLHRHRSKRAIVLSPMRIERNSSAGIIAFEGYFEGTFRLICKSNCILLTDGLTNVYPL